MKEDRIKVLKYMLAGAIGFGIGGVFWFLIYLIPSRGDMVASTTRDMMLGMIGVIMFAAIGGFSLGLVSRDIKNAFRLTLFSSTGFLIGFIVMYMVVLVGMFLAALGVIPYLLVLFLAFMSCGAVGGAFFGFALKEKIWWLPTAGALGFGIGFLLGFIISRGFGMDHMISYIITGLITGVFLGAGMYLAEKSTINPKEEVSE